MNRKVLSFLSFRYMPLIAIVLMALSCAQEETRAPVKTSAPGIHTSEIHSKHFFYGCPRGTQATNDLIIRDIYALSSNDQTKFADWVAYRLDEESVRGDATTRRNFKADPWLDDAETLEKDDYNGAWEDLGVDRGHQAPLASFKGTDCWAETNYLSNITPQKSALNQGPWKRLEEKVRDLVEAGHVVYVMTGPLYERGLPPLPGADEPHEIPSGYWKIIALETDSVMCASFMFDQETPRNAPVVSNLCTIDDVEAISNLDFLWQLPDDIEGEIESDAFEAWARANFD
jgi:endonuclease G